MRPEGVPAAPASPASADVATAAAADAPVTDDVVCLGETMVLFVPGDEGPAHEVRAWERTVGGAESNVACHLADLGVPSRWVSAVGDDPFGRVILENLDRSGVRVDGVRRDPDHPTGVYFKENAPGGTRVHYYRRGSAAAAMGPEMLDELDRGRTRLVHVSGITAALSASCRELLRSVVTHRRANELVSFDVNWRPALWQEDRWRDDEAGRELAELADAADLVLVGDDEARAIWDLDDVEAIRRMLPFPRTLVIKHGSRGATLVEDGQEWFEPALRVEVVEPVGAGDAFAAGFLAATLAGDTPVRRLRAGHLRAAAALGTTADVGAPLEPERAAALLDADERSWAAAVIGPEGSVR